GCGAADSCCTLAVGRPILHVDAQQQADQHTADDQAGAAVTHERQSQPLARQGTQIDTDIDEGLQQQTAANAVGQETVEQPACLDRPARGDESAPAHQQKQADDQQYAEQPEFLGKNSEQKIRMCFRKIQQFLHRVAESDTGNATAADGNQ